MKILRILKRWWNKTLPTFQDNKEYIETEKYIVSRNEWGKFKLKKRDVPTIINISENKIKFFGTYFNRGVLAYPNFKTKGISGLEGEGAIWSDIQYKFHSKNNIKYNVTYDIWLTKTKEIDFNNISHEIMIVEEHKDFSPAGKKILKDIVINGKLFDVYTGKIDKSREGLKGWQLTTFVRKHTFYSHPLNISKFFEIMKEQNILTEQLYMSEIEFGTEVFNDEGELEITKFDVKYVN